MKNLQVFFFILLLAVLAGCSSGNSDAPVIGSANHPANWVSLHGAKAKADLRGCQGCHGFDFKGSGNAVSCFKCHSSPAPPFKIHPATWNGDPLNSHQLNFQGTLSDQTPWTTCAVAACHGTKLEGGTVAPTCQNSTASCHTTGTNGWPPEPHGDFSSGAVHGPVAKGKTDPTLNMGNYCLLCHGTQPNIFDGGFVSDPAILNISGANCSATVCHSEARAHPSNWIPANNSIFHSDGSLNTQTKTEGCALCHNISAATPAGPLATAPSCFSATFQTQSCHASGPGSAPHAVPYTDPDLHGPAAKADLVFCQGCHGTTGTSTAVGAAGSNPRFNVPKGSLTAGCESTGCHAANTAHPTGTDRWTFNLDSTYPTRRTHFAAGLDSGGARDLTACSMCHDATTATADNTGTAAACTLCHQSQTASGPSVGVKCNYCHLSPPGTAADLTGGSAVNHLFGAQGDISAEALHQKCSLCHGASENGSSGVLVALNTSYALTLGNTSAAYQGGDHLDGNIEMNGPVGTGAGYDPAAFSCTQTCHGTEVGHVLSDSTLTVENGSYGAGACDSCHGYPPDGSGTSTNHFAANRDRGGAGSTTTDANFFSAHGICSTCHGLLGDTSPPTIAGNFGTPVDLSGSGGDAYDIATMHNQNLTSNIVQMNGQGGANFPPDDANAAYNETTNGCAAACHAADFTFVTVQANTVDLREFGSGNCTLCHGYPPAQGAHARHAGGGATNYAYDCQVCHPSSTATTHNESGIAPGGTIDPTKVQVTLPAFGNFPSGGTFNSTAKTCSSTYCHGGATPTWTGGAAEAACGTCHGDGTGRPDDASKSGDFHQNVSGHSIAGCTSCHTHDGTDLTEHVNGPPQTITAFGDALVSTAGLNITSHSYGGSTLGTDADGFKFTQSSCVTTCHGTGFWGGTGACDVCHDANNAFAPPSTPKVAYSGGAVAGKSTGYGSHLQLSAGENLAGVTDWALRCMSCHPGHKVLDANKQVLIPLPPTSWNSRDDNSGTTWNMQTRLGIDYAASGGDHGGINLGGSSTTSTFASAGTPTEAEICWGCHGAGPANDSVNEWGFNVDTNGASFPAVDIALDTTPAGASTTAGSHNYGWLYSDGGWVNPTADWTGSDGLGAYRRDAYQHASRGSGNEVLSRKMASTHSVNFVSGKQDSSVASNVNGTGAVNHASASLENRADLRCSYCHDVHDMNKAIDPSTLANETASGRPFLRGSWVGNLYPPDVPPLSVYSYGNTNKFLSNGKTFTTGTPRLFSSSAATQQKGGYFIDANSGRPTTNASFDTVVETAGLCTLCHDTNVDTMDYYTGSSLWRTDVVLANGNGHANSTLGGSGATDTTHARNLFDARRGGSVQVMANQVAIPVIREYGRSRYKNVAPFSGPMEKAHDTGSPTGPSNTGWYGGTVDTQARGSQYSTWYSASGIGDDASGSGRAHSFACSKCHSPHATGLPALLITNCIDKNLATWSTEGGKVTPSINQSNNCHRKEGTTSGWNRMATGQ